MDPGPARPQFHSTDCHTALIHRPQTDPPHHPQPPSCPFLLCLGFARPTSLLAHKALPQPPCPGNTYMPPNSLTRGLWCLRRNLMRKTLHTMHRGSLRYVVIEFYKQQSVFNHVCSFGTSAEQQHHRPTRKARSQLRGWMHLASTSWYSRIATECLHEPQYPALWWYSLFWSSSRDSSMNTCFRRNAHSLQNPPLLQPLWRVEPIPPAHSLCSQGLGAKIKHLLRLFLLALAANPAQGSDRGVTALLCYLWLCLQ